MKKLAVIAAVVLVGGGALYYYWPSKKTNGPKTETKRIKVERGNITVTVQATGEIKPRKEVELKSKASGQVIRFKKEPGDPVDEGELIAELDKRMELRNKTREESNFASAEAHLELTRLEYQRSLTQAQSELAAAQEDERQKKAELDRLIKLTGELVTQTELGNARLAARLAEEKLKQAQAALVLIRGRKEADEKLASADVQKAGTAVEDARERLTDTDIRAPIRGILLKKLVEEGQIVASGISASTGGTAIAIVANCSELIVEANVDETDIVKVKKGQAVEIMLLSGSNDRFKGHVELIVPKAELDSNVTIFKVRIAVDGDVFGKAYPGMTASVTIKVNESLNTLLVPTEAVKIEKKVPVVYIPNGEGSKPVPVKTGLDNGLKTEILSGLDESSEVVVTLNVVDDGNSSRRRFRGF